MEKSGNLAEKAMISLASSCCGKTFFLIMQNRTLAKPHFGAEILDSRFRGNDKKSLPQQELAKMVVIFPGKRQVIYRREGVQQ